MAQTHLALFEHQRESIQQQIKEISESYDIPPWKLFIALVDLRSEFGRGVALHFAKRVQIDRAIRAAEVRGEIPGFAVPVGAESGLEIVRMFVPALEEQVTHRPPLTIGILLVDQFDDPLIGIGRLHSRHLTVS